MIVLLDTPQDLDECSDQLGGIAVEQLFTPLTRRKPQRPEQNFAMDNGAFANFSAQGFRNMLSRHSERKHLCRWVAVPDVVGDARRTLEVFRHWRCQPDLTGWPLAFVAQDGQEHLPIPWNQVDAIFIGGSTDWKMGSAAAACVKAAKAIGKWVHVGRINTPARYEYFRDLGADSCDGTGLARYDHMRLKIYENETQPRLSIE
jgi:hypothetical protein